MSFGSAWLARFQTCLILFSVYAMDVLSAVSGIITLLGAGGTIIQGLERLSSLREAPNTVLALNNEVSDFRVAILELMSILQQESAISSISRAYNNNLGSVLRRAQDKLMELESLIKYRLLTPTSGSEIRLNKSAWILERHKIKQIQEEICSIRINLITILGIINSNSVSRLQVQLTDICLVGTRVQDQLTQAISRTDASFNLIRTQLTQIQAHSNRDSYLHNRFYSPVMYHQEQHTASHQRDGSQGQASRNINKGVSSGSYGSYSIPALLVSSRVQQRHLTCMPACTCRYHRISGWKSPQWLKSLLGLLFIGYVGIPLLSPSCNNLTCQYRSEPIATIQYYFPPWFAGRALQFYIQSSKYNNITQNLRTYRVMWNGSAFFRKTKARDLKGVKAILVTRQASPFNVNELGYTALDVITIVSTLL